MSSHLVEKSAVNSRSQQRAAAREFLATLQGAAHPNSEKVFLPGSRPAGGHARNQRVADISGRRSGCATL